MRSNPFEIAYVPKYTPLADHLHESGQDTLRMSFAGIERIIGASLPPSAFRHRAWWSNNPQNSVITRAWLEAGYRTARVNMTARTLEFVKVPECGPAPAADARAPEDAAEAPAVAGAAAFPFVFGELRGTVTIKPGTDLTAPVGAERDASR